MHRNDRRPRSLFGRTYVWLESESEKLCLVSIAGLTMALADAKAALDV